jgi:hypothetical protein
MMMTREDRTMTDWMEWKKRTTKGTRGRERRKNRSRFQTPVDEKRCDIFFLRWEEGDVRFDEEVLRLPA